ncbi:MAG: hypothetical protein ACOC24_02130 [Desulfovibrionales bacterium]
MKKSLILLMVAAVLTLLVATFPEQARSGVLVKQETLDGVRVVSGGVGQSEREYLQDLDGDFSLKLVFVLKSGSYLSQIPVSVTGQNRIALQTESSGPWMLMELPEGTYTVKATYEGVEKTREISVPSTGMKTEHFSWEK